MARRVLSQGTCHTRANLSYAAEHLTSIEVNGTFYSTQSPKTFRKWASEAPDGFVFSLKGPRYAVNRRELKGAGDSIKRFLEFRHYRTGTKARPPALAIRTVQEIRRSRFFWLPRTAAESHRRLRAAPCRRSTQRQLQGASLRRPAAKVRHRLMLRRARHLYRNRRHHRRFRLCAAAEGRRKTQSRLSAEGIRSMGGTRENLGGRRRTERPAEDRQDVRDKTAARRFHLFHSRGEDPRASRGHGADRAAR